MSVCILLTASCTLDYKGALEDLQNKIDALNQSRDDLEVITANLGPLRDVLLIRQAGDPVVSVTPSEKGYDFEFKNNGTVHVMNQTAGISVGNGNDSYYWTVGSTPITDANGVNLPISVSPQFSIEDGSISVSGDGHDWTAVALSENPVVQKVEDGEDCIAVTFLGGSVVEFPKESKIQVALSGDGSTMASEGRAVVDFLVSGTTGEYTVTPLLADGWDAEVDWENNVKGKVIFTAPAPVSDGSARLLFCDGIGHMTAADIDFSNLTVDETFPVMYPGWDAYSIAAEGGVADVTIYTNQDDYGVAIEDGAAWLSRAQTRAVREDVVSFAADKNETGAMRSALVTITAVNFEKKVVIFQEPLPVASGENLSANGTANCYIVSGEGDYYFDATVMGCGDSGIIAGVEFHSETSVLFPESVAIVFNHNDVVSDVTLDKTAGIVRFHATGAEGNAFISVKNSRNTVVWSWHIWCTDSPRERTHTNPDQLQFTVLDRNLGATSADPADGEATYGLYYQWGRKDPFDLTAATTGMATNSSHAFAFAIRYPQRAYSEDGNADGNWYGGLNDYLWGNPDYGRNHYLKDLVKTIYDPCPVGYMIPPANTFLIFEDETRTRFTEAGLIVRGDYGQEDFYPWAGRLHKNMNTRGREVALWHSCSARYGSLENAGGAQTRVEKETGMLYKYQGDIRARALPIRCVKQVAE